MKQQLVPLTQLNLTNRFLFDEVMDDAQTHQDVLSIILGRDIPLLEQNISEKEHRISPLARSVRMDVFAIIIRRCSRKNGMTFKNGADIISL